MALATYYGGCGRAVASTLSRRELRGGPQTEGRQGIPRSVPLQPEWQRGITIGRGGAWQVPNVRGLRGGP